MHRLPLTFTMLILLSFALRRTVCILSVSFSRIGGCVTKHIYAFIWSLFIWKSCARRYRTHTLLHLYTTTDNYNTVEPSASRQEEAVYFSRGRCTACRQYEHVENIIIYPKLYLNYKPDCIFGEYRFALQSGFQREHPKTMHQKFIQE